MGARKQRKPVEVVPPPPPPSRAARIRQALRRTAPAVIATGAVSVCVLVLALIFGQAPLLVGAAPDPDADRDLSAGGSEFLDVDDPRRVLQGTGSPTEALATVGPPSTTIVQTTVAGSTRPPSCDRWASSGLIPAALATLGWAGLEPQGETPTTDPPTTDPTTEPPTSEPPTSEPPTSEPPTSEPPTTEPPTTDPTTSPPTSPPPTSPPTTQPPTTSQPPYVPPTYPDPPGC